MYIVSIKTSKREKEVPNVQQILTNYGEAIDTRLGINLKDNNGLIIVVYSGSKIEEFVGDLNSIESVEVNFMEA